MMLMPPETLVDLQKWFIQFEMRPFRETGRLRLPQFGSEMSRAIEQKIAPGPKLSSAERMGIYNQQFWYRFFTLLQNCYPTLLRLFGYRDFNFELVEPYVLCSPPRHWALRKVGSLLPQWIEANYWEADRDLVLQIAQLEEVYDRLRDETAFPAAQGGDVKNIVRLQPFIALFDLDADWTVFQRQLLAETPAYWLDHEFPPIDWFEVKRSFVFYREGQEVLTEELSELEAIALRSFQRGASFEEVSALFGEECCVEGSIQKWVDRGWLYNGGLS